MRSGKLAAWGTAALVCASVLAPAAQAQDFFSQLFGGFGRPRQQPYIQMPFGNDDGQVYAPRGEGRAARWRRRPGVLRADLRRALFPGHRLGQCEPRGQSATVSARRARPRCSTAAASTTRPPKTENPIRSCRTRSAIATNSSAAAPATARTRSVSRRSRSRTIRRCARATSSPARTACLVAGRSADKRGAELNFSPASDEGPRQI